MDTLQGALRLISGILASKTELVTLIGLSVILTKVSKILVPGTDVSRSLKIMLSNSKLVSIERMRVLFQISKSAGDGAIDKRFVISVSDGKAPIDSSFP